MAFSAILPRARREFRLLEMLQQMFRVIEFDVGMSNAGEIGWKRRMPARETFHLHLMAGIALRVSERRELRIGAAMFRVAHAAIRLAQSQAPPSPLNGERAGGRGGTSRNDMHFMLRILIPTPHRQSLSPLRGEGNRVTHLGLGL